MDSFGIYRGSSSVRRLSRKEIEQMKKNMKKVPEIQLKSDIYHDHELQEAEALLHKVYVPEAPLETTQEEYRTQDIVWYRKVRKQLIHGFTSLFSSHA